MLLKGRIAIVTGASKGIGRAIAETFVMNGAAVIITARSDSILELASKQGGRVRAVQGDLRDENHLKEIIKTCRSLHGRLDILVNNAGILEQSLLGMIPMEAVRDMLEVNLVSMINLTQYAIRLMGKSTAPAIINLSSIAGVQGIEGLSAYAASKAAVVGFTLSSAKELASKGIRVNAIAPGFIDTDMARGLSEERFDQRVKSIRLGRIGTPKDVAGSALFLASDLASFITGQVIGVDGGMAV